jgi:N-methylhydantoinase A
VPLAGGRFDGEADVEALVDAFHEEHDRVFAVREHGRHVECLTWKARATAALPKPALPGARAAARARARVTRTAVFAAGPSPTPRYRAEELGAGVSINGPAVAEEQTTTIVVPPGWTLTVGDPAAYVLTPTA